MAEHDNKRKGILFIILSSVGFSLMSLFVRLSGDVPVFEKAFFRNVVAAAVSIFLLVRSKEKIRLPRGAVLPLFLRCAFGTAGLVANFWAIDNIALADANMLNKMSPVFATIMSAIFLQEKPNFRDTVCIALALVGAVFVVKPGTGMFRPAAVVGLLGGLGAGIAYTCIRHMGTHGVKGPVIVAAFSVFSCVTCAILMQNDFIWLQPRQALCLLAAGAGAALGQLSITAAYTYAPAREITVFDYTQVLFAAFWAFLVWHELPDWLSIAGYILIIGTAVYRWHMTMKEAGAVPARQH